MSKVKFIVIDLHKLFEVKFPEPVWLLRVDVNQNLLAIETRDPDLLLVSFWVLNTATGTLELEHYRTPDLWWVGLEGIQENLMYLHNFGKDGFGQHQGITAIDFEQKSISWQNSDLRFYGLTPNNLLAQSVNKNQEEIKAVNALTGEIIPVPISVAEAKARLAETEKAAQYFWQVPVQYKPGQVYFEQVKQFIKVKSGKIAAIIIEYLEWKEYIILGFYQVADQNLHNFVVQVYSNTGEIVLQEILGEGLAGNKLDTFFIMQETLILIKNKKSLLGFRL